MSRTGFSDDHSLRGKKLTKTLANSREHNKPCKYKKNNPFFDLTSTKTATTKNPFFHSYFQIKTFQNTKHATAIPFSQKLT